MPTQPHHHDPVQGGVGLAVAAPVQAMPHPLARGRRIGEAPPSMENAAWLWSRPGLSPAATSSAPAISGPTPHSRRSRGAAWAVSRSSSASSLASSASGRGGSGHPQRAHHRSQVAAGLGNGGDLPGQHRSSGRLGSTGSDLPRRRRAERSGRLTSRPAGHGHRGSGPGRRHSSRSPPPPTPGLTQPAGPRQHGHSRWGWWQPRRWPGVDPAGRGTGHMHLAVGVDAPDDPPGVGVCDGDDGRLPSGQGSMVAPAERADTTARSLGRQAPDLLNRGQDARVCSP